MVAFVHASSVRRLTFPILVLLLVLGQACELPAYVDLVRSAHSADQESPHSGHHAGKQAISCDPVGIASSAGYLQGPEALDLPVALGVNDLPPRRMVARAFEGPAKSAFRPPLFLLHASFLI
jgi:hypothetical protein